MGALYRLAFPNGKSYVGITIGPVEARFREHLKAAASGKPWAVHRALRKYGAENTVCHTLAVSNDWDYLQLVERRAIKVFDTFGKKGYNMTAGGEGILGLRHSAESKAKMSRRQTGRRLSPAHRENVVRALRKHTFDATGTKQSPEVVEKRRIAMLLSAKGVSWCKQTGKWRAHISVGGAMKHLGRFEEYDDAVAVRHAAVLAYVEKKK